jgi:hypothetical protein
VRLGLELALLPSPWMRLAQGNDELAEELREAPWVILFEASHGRSTMPPWYVGHRRARVEEALALRPAHALRAGGEACRWSDLAPEELPPAPLRRLFLPREGAEPYLAGAVFTWKASEGGRWHRRAVIASEWRLPSGRVQLWAEGVLPSG